MPSFLPTARTARVLPFTLPPRTGRHSGWPFTVASMKSAGGIQIQAARVIATTARHWLGRPFNP